MPCTCPADARRLCPLTGRGATIPAATGISGTHELGSCGGRARAGRMPCACPACALTCPRNHGFSAGAAARQADRTAGRSGWRTWRRHRRSKRASPQEAFGRLQERWTGLGAPSPTLPYLASELPDASGRPQASPPALTSFYQLNRRCGWVEAVAASLHPFQQPLWAVPPRWPCRCEADACGHRAASNASGAPLALSVSPWISHLPIVVGTLGTFIPRRDGLERLNISIVRRLRRQEGPQSFAHTAAYAVGPFLMSRAFVPDVPAYLFLKSRAGVPNIPMGCG